MKIFYLLFIIFFSIKAKAQPIFLTKGKVEFEKRVNIHKNLEASAYDNSYIKEIIKRIPSHEVSYFNLYFNSNESLYMPGKDLEEPSKIPDWFKGPATKNIVYKNTLTKKSISQKAVFESNYLIEDSIRCIEWKIKNEIRTIAGFDCRRAEAIIMDSIYVIAYYTDKIIADTGPESINGLPGMILGLVVPRIYTTWFATRVELDDSNFSLKPPAKGKKTTNRALIETLQTALKDWGKSADRNIWRIML